MKIAYTKSAKGLSRNNCVTLWGRALACGRLQSAPLKGPRRPQRPTEVAPQVETCPTSPQQRVHDWNGYFMTMPKSPRFFEWDGANKTVARLSQICWRFARETNRM